MSIFDAFKRKAEKGSVPNGIIERPIFTSSADKFPLGVGAGGEVVWDKSISYANHLMIVGASENDKNIILRSIIKHGSEFPERYATYGIDLSNKELTSYLKYPSSLNGIATTIDETLDLLQGIEEEMKHRREFFKLSNIANIQDTQDYHHIIVVINEALEIFSLTDKTDEKNLDLNKTKLEIMSSIDNISSLGRNDGVSIVLSSNHQEICNLIPEIMMINFSSKVLMGAISSDQASKLFLDKELNIKDTKGYFFSPVNQGEEFQLYNVTWKSFDDRPFSITGIPGGKKFLRQPMSQDRVELSAMNKK